MTSLWVPVPVPIQPLERLKEKRREGFSFLSLVRCEKTLNNTSIGRIDADVVDSNRSDHNGSFVTTENVGCILFLQNASRRVVRSVRHQALVARRTTEVSLRAADAPFSRAATELRVRYAAADEFAVALLAAVALRRVRRRFC